MQVNFFPFFHLSLSSCRAEIPIVALPNTAQNENNRNIDAPVPPDPANLQQPLQNQNQNDRASGPGQPRINEIHQPEDYVEHPQLPPGLLLDERAPEFTLPITRPTSPQLIKKAIPGFFVVLAYEEMGTEISYLDVKNEPNYSPENPTLRTICQVIDSSFFPFVPAH